MSFSFFMPVGFADIPPQVLNLISLACFNDILIMTESSGEKNQVKMQKVLTKPEISKHCPSKSISNFFRERFD